MTNVSKPYYPFAANEPNFPKFSQSGTEELYKILFHHSNDAAIMYEPDGNIIDINRKALELFGYTNSEFLMLKIRDLHPESALEKLRRAFEKISKSGYVNFQIDFAKKDGSIFTADVSSSLFDIDGRKIIHGIVHDITDSMETEEKIARQNAFLHSIIESLTHPFYVIDADSYEIKIANSASGQRESTMNSTCYKAIHRSDRPCDEHKETCPIKILQATGKPTTVEHVHYDKDGNPKYFEVHAYPIIDSSGKVAQVIEYTLDVTERRVAEDQLQMEKAYFEELFESAPEAIVVVDNDGIIMRCNGEFTNMFGYKPEEVRQRSIDEMLGSDIYFEEASFATKQLARGLKINMETKRRRKDGTYIDVSILAVPITVGSGQVAYYAIYRDISERKRTYRERQELREKLAQAQRMESLGVLAGGVAHDLNNILGPLVTYPELIRMKLEPESPIADKILKIEKSAQRAVDVVQDLLTMARRGRYEMVPLDLNEVINSYIKSPDFASLHSNNPEIEFRLDLDETIPPTAGSSTHLYKMVMNLIINAYDAMPGGGTLTIKTHCGKIDRLVSGFSDFERGRFNIITISDTGVGISENDQKHIFEPFYSKKKLGRSGSGLGLSIVYGVIKDHNGYIDMRSELEKGSDFYVYLPVIDREIVSNKEEAVFDIRGSEKILVVDDICEQRDLAATVLSCFGYRVDTVPSGEKAIEYLKENEVDVVILDMIMDPGKDGLDTYKEIIKIHPGQKAIIATGFSETDRVKKAESLGIGRTVRKPYTMQMLGKAIREVLAARQDSHKTAAARNSIRHD